MEVRKRRIRYVCTMIDESVAVEPWSVVWWWMCEYSRGFLNVFSQLGAGSKMKKRWNMSWVINGDLVMLLCQLRLVSAICLMLKSCQC